MSLAKKLKMIVKGEQKPTFGTDPNEPWSVRAGITESETSMLGSYLKSRGINPEFVSKDTKISHAKSSEFSKWKRDHMFDDPADTVSSVARDKMKSQREEIQFDEAKTIQGTALDKFRQSAAERAKKHDDAEKEMKARHAAGKEDMKGSIDRLEKQLNKEESGISKTKETSFHKKLDKLVHSTFGKRKDEMKMKEEVPWVVEDVFQDTQAATQTAFDMGTQADDREPTYSRKKEMSKSARMIKSLYKKHKMVKEELYDHEKEDKSVATYGKKPKAEKVQVDGDENNQAAMVLKGGKTLTGQTRDTLEIDPVMKKPSNPDNKNNSTKTDK